MPTANPFSLALARAEVAEGFSDGVSAELGLINLSGPIQGKKSVGHDVHQGVKIGVGKTRLALQRMPGLLVRRTEKRNAACSEPIGIANKNRQKTSRDKRCDGRGRSEHGCQIRFLTMDIPFFGMPCDTRGRILQGPPSERRK